MKPFWETAPSVDSSNGIVLPTFTQIHLETNYYLTKFHTVKHPEVLKRNDMLNQNMLSIEFLVLFLSNIVFKVSNRQLICTKICMRMKIKQQVLFFIYHYYVQKIFSISSIFVHLFLLKLISYTLMKIFWVRDFEVNALHIRHVVYSF